MTLELSLSRAEAKRLASRLVSSSRDHANYRTLTDVEAAKKVINFFIQGLKGQLHDNFTV
jgi:hypothetical protein